MALCLDLTSIVFVRVFVIGSLVYSLAFINVTFLEITILFAKHVWLNAPDIARDERDLKIKPSTCFLSCGRAEDRTPGVHRVLEKKNRKASPEFFFSLSTSCHRTVYVRSGWLQLTQGAQRSRTKQSQHHILGGSRY